MSQNNVGYIPEEIQPSAPPRSAIYDEVPGDTRSNSISVVPAVYPRRTIITVQPQNQIATSEETNQPARIPVPVNTARWVSTPRDQLNALVGTDFLNGIEQLEILQTVQLSTLLGENKSGNQYKVKVPRAETLFLASETTTTCRHSILGSSKSLSLSLMDPTGQVAFKFRKDLSWGCVPGFLHKMSVECLEPIGSVEQNFTFLGASFTIYDNARNPLCQIQGPNIFCCCVSQESQFQIVSLDGTHQIASLIRQWDHQMLDYTITLTVPSDANVKLKGLLLGAAFLLEYLYFERLTKR